MEMLNTQFEVWCASLKQVLLTNLTSWLVPLSSFLSTECKLNIRNMIFNHERDVLRFQTEPLMWKWLKQTNKKLIYKVVDLAPSLPMSDWGCLFRTPSGFCHMLTVNMVNLPDGSFFFLTVHNFASLLLSLSGPCCFLCFIILYKGWKHTSLHWLYTELFNVDYGYNWTWTVNSE